jgi:hypothetical protein
MASEEGGEAAPMVLHDEECLRDAPHQKTEGTMPTASSPKGEGWRHRDNGEWKLWWVDGKAYGSISCA